MLFIYLGFLLRGKTALQARGSRVPFPMMSLEFFIDIILPAALWLSIKGKDCATSQKVAGSIPDDVIGIFH